MEGKERERKGTEGKGLYFKIPPRIVAGRYVKNELTVVKSYVEQLRF